MKHYIYIVAAICVGCNTNQPPTQTQADSDTVFIRDTVTVTQQPQKDSEEPTTQSPPDNNNNTNNPPPKQVEEKPKPSQKTYSNKRFRNVTVEKVSENKFRIKGEGQIFEAAFGWVIEDGHNELKKGFEMTDAGAPAWGNFNFTVEAKKQRPNSTLHIVLFETSAKDGSRQYQLPIPLK